MKKVIAFTLLFLTIGCAHQPFTQSDKILLGTSLTLQAIDWQQTKEIAKDPYRRESNMILGEYPSQHEVDLYFLTTTLSCIAVAYYLPPKWRNVFWGFWIGVEGGYVTHNYQVGIRF